MYKTIIRALVALMLLTASAARAVSPETRTTLERARDLFECGRWSDARHELLRVREALLPADRMEHQEVDYLLAACAVELGSDDAAGALREFGRRYPGSVFGNDVRFSLASYYCSVGRTALARETFARVDYEALSPARREQYDIRMGYVCFAEGDYDRAYGYFADVDSRSEYADHARYYMAYIDYVGGHNDRARQGFRSLLGSAAYADVVPYYLLQLEFRAGNYDYVVREGDALVRRAVGERRAELERIIAESWFHLEDYNRTVAHLEAYRSEGGADDRETNYLRGFSLYRSARYGDAAEWLRRACGAEDALTQNASYHLADCYLRLGDKQSAMQAFAMAADSRFDAQIAEDALFNYGKLQYELGGGAFNGAINVLGRYLNEYPSSPRAGEARTLLVAAYYNARDYEAAYRAIRSMPSADADMRAALQKITYFRALEAYEAGDLKTAQRMLAESAAVNVSPKYGALNTFWQGEIAYAGGDYATAAAKYNAYLKRAPATEREYALSWYNLGYCAFSRGDLPLAERSFAKFLDSYPARDAYRGDACNRLGDIRFGNRQFEDAVVEYDRAIALGGSGRFYAQYKRALTLGLLDRADQKRAALRQIVAAGQGDYVDAASYELGRTYIAAEQYAEGAAQLERFIRDYPRSPRRAQALSDLGLAYLNLGDRRKSLSYYDQVVREAPTSSEAKGALQGIRDIYVSEGDVDAYFDYAARAGVESDLTALSRDSLSFAAAQKLYLAGDRAASERSLRSYLRSYPKGYYRTDALYYLSDCYLQDKNTDAAIGTLTELADAGTTPYTQTVLERLSELTFAAKRYDEAASAYRRLYEAVASSSGKASAMTGYVRATVAGGDERKIAAMAADVAAKRDAGPTARREALFADAERLRRAGDLAEASKRYRELASDPRTAEGSAAGYYLIEERFRSGDMDRTEKAVFDFSEREPRPYWLAKAYILLGDVYLRKGDTFQARATWQSVVDGYTPADDGIVAEAGERIAKMK